MQEKIDLRKKIKFNSSEAIYALMKEILLKKSKIDQDKEHFWVVALNTAHYLKHIVLIGLGTPNSVLVHPIDIFSIAFKVRAIKLILVHNHPSGNLVPSNADLAITKKLLTISLFFEIPVIDHIIIAKNGYFSFTDENILDRCRDEDFLNNHLISNKIKLESY